MIRPELQICAAVALDLVLGDPRKLPHPVQLIALIAERFERIFRRWFSDGKKAGAATWLLTVAFSGGTVLLLVWTAILIHPAAYIAVSVYLLYTTIAARGLSAHCMDVYRALASGSIEKGRASLSLIVSRDTSDLDREAVVRSTVESMSENFSDGVVAPLFYGVLGGPVLAMVYKTLSTMDSMFGYKTPKYLEFGYVPAKADDAANFLPARISALIVGLGAPASGGRVKEVIDVVRKDARKHASPNSGFPEAAFAGALGIRFGGRYRYFGKFESKPVIGKDKGDIDIDIILRARRLLWLSYALSLLIFLGLRVGLSALLRAAFMPAPA